MTRTPLLTLTTDFGTSDGYIGAMKGAIASVDPRIAVHDLTHEIPPQGVREAAFALYRAVPFWPSGTVHCVVVDPGVGTERRPIAVATRDEQVLVGPDSGLFTLFCPPFVEVEPVAVELTERRWWRAEEPSATFHGRDVFAPVAAHLARESAAGSIDLASYGSPIDAVQRFDMPVPKESSDAYRGEVVHVDHFGNVVTNLPEGWVRRAGGSAVVEAGGKTIPVVRTYGDVEVGTLCALVGSSGWLEVSEREGSAAERLGLAAGIPVVLRKPSEGSA